MSTLLRTVLGGAALLLAGSIGLAAPASADTASGSTATASTAIAEDSCLPDFREFGTNIRAEPTTASPILGQGNPGDCLQSHSQAEGQLVHCESGTQSTLWYNITNLRTGVTGWISACLWP